LKKTLLLSLSFALSLSFFFISCGKELSFENVATGGGTARYSLNGGTASCTGATLSGTFTAGTPVTAANTVTLSVTVDSVGSYIISTNTINGISFNGSGVFTSTGVQNITLTASGTPATAGIYDFTPVANGCTFSVTVATNNGGTSGTAAYSLNGGTSSCTGALVTGTFTAGTAASSGNTVVLNIVVDTVGTYSISTNAVNGITFTGTGTFTTTGAQTITLTASGTPASSGTFAFTPGANGCTFNVTVTSSGGGGGSGNFLKCKIDGALTNFNKSLVGYYIIPPSSGIPYSVSVQGKNSDVAGSLEELWVTVSNPTNPTTGIYNNYTFSTGMTDRGCMVAFYPTGFPNIYWGSSAFDANTLTVNITSVSTSSAAGTFAGTIYETNGLGPSTKQVTEGEFKITF
jgi:hypothetical protein